jgi:hypothetical protein
MWFGAPALPLAECPGSAVFRRWTLLETVRFPAFPLCEFCFRVGLCPVPPSFRPAPKRCRSSSHGLSLPYSTCSQEGPLIAGFTCPLRSTLRVWLPSRWFAPFKASPALFRAGSALGKSPFGAFSSPEVPGRFRPSGLTYRLPQRFLRRPKAPARPDGSRFLSFNPLESPLRPDVCLIHRPPEAPVGFPPSRVHRKQPSPGFRRKPSRVLGRHGPQAAARTSEYQSVAAWFLPQQGTRPSTDETTLLGFRAKSIPSIRSQEIFGLWVHLTPP